MPHPPQPKLSPSAGHDHEMKAGYAVRDGPADSMERRRSPYIRGVACTVVDWTLRHVWRWDERKEDSLLGHWTKSLFVICSDGKDRASWRAPKGGDLIFGKITYGSSRVDSTSEGSLRGRHLGGNTKTK